MKRAHNRTMFDILDGYLLQKKYPTGIMTQRVKGVFKMERNIERRHGEIPVILEYVILTFAALLASGGIYFFRFPNNFTFGGVAGLAVVLSNILPFSAALLNTLLNAVLLVIGFIFLGKGFGVKTVYVTVLSSAAVWALEYLFPMSQPFTDQPMLEFIYAIGLPSAGSAILFVLGASSGGTDIIAMILKKHFDTNIGISLMIADLFVCLSAFAVFGTTTGLYSLCGLLMKALVIDRLIESINLKKYFTVITMDPEPICEYIHGTLGRAATVYNAQGSYTHQDRVVILTVMSRKEGAMLRRYIEKNQPAAFLMVTNSSEIVGKGFKSF